MDTDAIRRAWPNVLGRIFTMRRITWTFVSQNAQVTAFDGRKLTLGIATAGLTQTFRAGNHADIVRQALIDELGVDAIVDGIHVDTVSQQAPVAPPPGAAPVGLPDPPSKGEAAGPADSSQGGQGGQGSAPQGGPGADRSSWGDAGAGHESAGPGSSASTGTGGAGGGAAGGASSSAPGSRGATALADAGLSPVSGRSMQDNAGWGSATGPAPDWATGPSPAAQAGAPAVPAPTAPSAAPAAEAPTDSAVRGASAVRQSFAQARSRAGGSRPTDDDQPRQPVTDDSAVSDDDEDIEQSGDVGRSVIEKVLGGRVVQELEN
jgi:DNA polymerase-3 subunit gamma/tau